MVSDLHRGCGMSSGVGGRGIDCDVAQALGLCYIL